MMGDKPDTEKTIRYCPYCDDEIAEVSFPYCEPCKVTIFYCPKCRQSISRDNKICPHCGADIREEILKEE